MPLRNEGDLIYEFFVFSQISHIFADEARGNGILGLGIGCARRAERKEDNGTCQGVGSRGYARFKKRFSGHE
jgi:hypothetical protein